MNKRACFMGLIGILLANVVSAATVIPPPDLNPGDQYRLVFVTSGATTANSDDISTYNNLSTRRLQRFRPLVSLPAAGLLLRPRPR